MLFGCAGPAMQSDSHPATRAQGAPVKDVESQEQQSRNTVDYYISKLADRSFVKTYGGIEHPRTWYTAAEALGEIGSPAIPALVERLSTSDQYELMLALYALMLASQDPALQVQTGGDYLRLDTVLIKDTNEENRRRALDWWQRYRHLWPGTSG